MSCIKVELGARCALLRYQAPGGPLTVPTDVQLSCHHTHEDIVEPFAGGTIHLMLPASCRGCKKRFLCTAPLVQELIGMLLCLRLHHTSHRDQ